jgi:uncharacterized membrane protein YphA (DoxX/SURF4 family)
VPRNVRQISFLACLLLVVLRVSIGWQFLYEGLWKLNTQKTARPWTAEGYLANARGPFRDKFRSLVDDPDGLKKLDFDTMVARWDDWKNRFIGHYPTLSDEQKQELDRLLDGPKEFTQALATLPKGVDLKKFKPRKYKAPDGWYLRYNPKAKRLETNLHLVPEEREALLKLVEPQPTTDDERAAAADPRTPKPELDDAAKKFQQAINRLSDRSGKLGLKDRLQVLLKEDPDRNGVVLAAQEGTTDYSRPGKKQVFENLLGRYELNLKAARQTFQQEHLAKQWSEIMQKKGELLGPIDALTTELRENAYKLLTVEQTALGPVPETPNQVTQINQITMWALTILGVTLMAGFLSRLSALGAAGLLLLFYLPMPPWPGVPEAPGPEHSLFVNKNLIEVFACLALASLPTGRWIGLDAFIRRFVFFRKTD